MSDIPVVVQRQVLVGELREWEVARYQMSVRHRVNKRIGADAEVLARIVADLERCEKAIDVLAADLEALDAPPPMAGG